MASTSPASITLYASSSSPYVFPTAATGVATTSSFPGSVPTSGNGQGFGITGRAGTSFQTVIISLVALALLTVISAVFIFYRRRRLASRGYADHMFRSDSGQAWDNILFPGGGAAAAAARRREKEEKDYGLVPVIWEVEVGVGAGKDGGESGGKSSRAADEEEAMLDVSLEDVEGQLDRSLGSSGTASTELPDLRPLSLGILTTAPPSSGKPPSSSSRPGNTSSRSQSTRDRTYAYPGADEAYISSRNRPENRTIPAARAGMAYPPGQSDVEGVEMMDVWKAAAPGSVSFLIAMPQPPAYREKQEAREERRASVVQRGGIFEEGEEDFEIPDVVIGSMDLDLGRMTQEEQRRPSVLAADPLADPLAGEAEARDRTDKSQRRSYEDNDWEAMGFRADEEAKRSSRTTVTTEDNLKAPRRKGVVPHGAQALNKEELTKLRLQLGLSAEAA